LSNFRYICNWQALLENPAVRQEVLVTHNSTSGFMRDFCDGEFIKQHPVFMKHPTALQIVLYYDDIEIANPLGSKAGIHKLGKLHHTCMTF